jgi:hypothetical protein
VGNCFYTPAGLFRFLWRILLAVMLVLFSAVNCAAFVLQLLFTVFSDSFGGSSDLCVQLRAFLFAGCKFGARCELCLVWSIVHRDHVKFVAFLASTWGV